ncbi:MAG: AI-2E family transporter, partial [bacterium]|nr:AI-2E family transporter [bacterium]
MSLLSNDIQNIRISTGTIVRFFLVALLLVTLYFISDVILVVLAAIILASAAEPVIRRFKRYKMNRIVTVVLIYVIIASAVAGVLVFFLPVVLSETSDFLKTIPSTVPLDTLLSPIIDIGSSFTTSSSAISGQVLSIGDYVKSLQNLMVGDEGAFRTVSVLFGGFLSLIFIIVISFYLAVQEDGVDDFLRIVSPVKHHAYIIDLWKRSQRKIGLWLQGQI